MNAELAQRPSVQIKGLETTQQNLHTDTLELNTQSFEVATHDLLLYRIVVGTLGLAILITLVGSIILSMFGKPAPEVLIALGSASAGALAGFLVPASAKAK